MTDGPICWDKPLGQAGKEDLTLWRGGRVLDFCIRHEAASLGVTSLTLGAWCPVGPRHHARCASRRGRRREFLAGLEPQDRVLLIGDTRQHQGVEAGRPFEQLQQAGMRTAHLDEIVRQKDPALKAAVESLAKGDVSGALQSLEAQGRIREISDAGDRIRAIAHSYVESPERTLIVSPDNASRLDLNIAVREELKANGSMGRLLCTTLPPEMIRRRTMPVFSAGVDTAALISLASPLPGGKIGLILSFHSRPGRKGTALKTTGSGRSADLPRPLLPV